MSSLFFNTLNSFLNQFPYSLAKKIQRFHLERNLKFWKIYQKFGFNSFQYLDFKLFEF